MAKITRNKVVYTCITGEYDELFNHQYVDPDWDYVCFSDNIKPSSHNNSWRIVPLKNKAADNPRTNRWHKINAHLCLEDYEYSVYIDANIDVLNKEFFDEIRKQIDVSSAFSIMKHPERDCIYDEIEVCIELKKDDPVVMKSQGNTFMKEEYPKHNGLYASSILFRKQGDKDVLRIMEDWWSWVRDRSRRDQLSLPYVLWKHNYEPGTLHFRYALGKSGPLFFYPHSTEKNDYMRRLFDKIENITAENQDLKNLSEEMKNRLEKIEKHLAVIENSKTWRIRKKFIRKLGNH